MSRTQVYTVTPNIVHTLTLPDRRIILPVLEQGTVQVRVLSADSEMALVAVAVAADQVDHSSLLELVRRGPVVMAGYH